MDWNTEGLYIASCNSSNRDLHVHDVSISIERTCIDLIIDVVFAFLGMASLSVGSHLFHTAHVILLPQLDP